MFPVQMNKVAMANKKIKTHRNSHGGDGLRPQRGHPRRRQTALGYGMEIIGFRDGFRGIVEDRRSNSTRPRSRNSSPSAARFMAPAATRSRTGC